MQRVTYHTSSCLSRQQQSHDQTGDVIDLGVVVFLSLYTGDVGRGRFSHALDHVNYDVMDVWQKFPTVWAVSHANLQNFPFVGSCLLLNFSHALYNVHDVMDVTHVF